MAVKNLFELIAKKWSEGGWKTKALIAFLIYMPFGLVFSAITEPAYNNEPLYNIASTTSAQPNTTSSLSTERILTPRSFTSVGIQITDEQTANIGAAGRVKVAKLTMTGGYTAMVVFGESNLSARAIKEGAMDPMGNLGFAYSCVVKNIVLLVNDRRFCDIAL